MSMQEPPGNTIVVHTLPHYWTEQSKKACIKNWNLRRGALLIAFYGFCAAEKLHFCKFSNDNSFILQDAKAITMPEVRKTCRVLLRPLSNSFSHRGNTAMNRIAAFFRFTGIDRKSVA